MSIKKQLLKSKPECKVTFAVDKKTIGQARQVTLVGDFNGWDQKNMPFTKLKNGSFKTAINLAIGKEYQFRYLIDGKNWINETDADKFVPSGVSNEENAVITL